jgi:hypothetical protein
MAVPSGNRSPAIRRFRWFEALLLMILVGLTYATWTRSVRVTDSNWIRTEAVLLNHAQLMDTAKAIDYLKHDGYRKEAEHLRGMFTENRILLDPGLGPKGRLANFEYGKSTNAYFWFQRHSIGLSPVLFNNFEATVGKDVQTQDMIFLASVLLHEEVHTRQSDYFGNINSKEQEAYIKQLKFLEREESKSTGILKRCLLMDVDIVKIDLSSYVPHADVAGFCAKHGI